MPKRSTRFSRRSFVRIAASATPAVVGLYPRVQARTEAEGRLGVVLCGLGGFAKQSIAPELPHASRVHLAGVVTGDAAKGRAWAATHGFPERNIFSYAEMDRLADAKDVAIVHVATPNALHARHVIAAAKAGKHVMCEKPMATSSADCEAMIAACNDAGVRLGVNYRLQWEPHHVKAVEAVRDGAVGTPSNGSYEFSWNYAGALSGPGKDTIKKWLLDPAMAGGGAMFDTGVYPVQAACSLTGKLPVAVQASASTRHRELFPAGVEETMTFTLLFDDGFQAQCRASYSGNQHRCLMFGPKGGVEVLGGDRGSTFGQSGSGRPNPKRLMVGGTEVPAENTLQIAVLLDEFAKAITDGSAFKADGGMGLRDVRIVEAIYASARQGGARVELKSGA